MAIEAELVSGFPQLRVIVRAVDIVTGGAGHTVTVHHALHEIVALHSVLVGSSIGEVQEVGLSKADVFELPVIRQTQADVIAHRPVVGFAVDETSARTALGMALDAGIVCVHVVHLGRVQNVGARWMGDMLAAGSVATLAADVPL